jgi:hypothetical protein
MPFEGFLPCASGGQALPDQQNGVKIIEILGEAEFQSVRWACGVSGQVRGLTHRRSDSDSFRLFEVAGMAHRESRYSSVLDIKRFEHCDLNGAVWSTFPNSFIYAAIYEMMVNWTGAQAIQPTVSKYLLTVENTDEIVRDEHGNAQGGVRSLHVDVPTSTVIAATPMGRPSWYRGESIRTLACFALTQWQGSERPFSIKRLRNLYIVVENYRTKAGQAINKQIKTGFLLPCDAEVLRRESVESLEF